MKFKIITLGCKVNTYESEFMGEALKKEGFIYDEEEPNIIIINTCSVTNTANNKSFKMVRREQKLFPNSIILVCGCATQNNPDKAKDLNATLTLGTKDKSKVVTILKDYLKTHRNHYYIDLERKVPFEDMKVEKFTTHTRAFMKIQDGCDNFCSYCIIPYTRGSIRSKAFNEVINEAKTLVANHHQEIVLTGIHTGSYYDNGHDLSDVISSLASIEGLKRIRLSSIEITELNDKFLNVLKNTDSLVDHLHIPLQSGSDAVLKVMNRKYDLKFFKAKIAKIREIRPDIAISTDVIVGHPYETEAEFQTCLKTCQELEFSKIHVFPYSQRKGTPSAEMPQVDAKIKKERVEQLIKLSNELEHNYWTKFLNKELTVLIEEYENGFSSGFTSNYLRIFIPKKLELNKIYKIIVKEIQADKIIGAVSLANNQK